MNIVFTSINTTTIVLPIVFLFWANVCVYVLHIFEETVIPEVFVEKVRRLYFPKYNWKKFFGFNTFLILLNIFAIVLFESSHGTWIIFPLALMSERAFNGLYHLAETIKTKKYSSGLLTSVITWILMYLVIRYSFLKGQINSTDFLTSIIIGFLITIIMIVPMVTGIFKKMK
jgi:hypothetical protein